MSARKIVKRQVILPSGVSIGRLFEEKRVEGRRAWYAVCAGVEVYPGDTSPFDGCSWEGQTTLGQQKAADDLVAHHQLKHADPAELAGQEGAVFDERADAVAATAGKGK